jgi:hypothetical protein
MGGEIQTAGTPAQSSLAGSVGFRIAGEIDEKTEVFLEDELQNLVAAIGRDCPPLAIQMPSRPSYRPVRIKTGLPVKSDFFGCAMRFIT